MTASDGTELPRPPLPPVASNGSRDFGAPDGRVSGSHPTVEVARAIEAPHLHVPRLVVSRDVAGERSLDRIADAVNRLIGSMWLFVGITLAIVVWLFAGNVVGFDRTPWPLLLTILNLPQLSIMISLQVSANRAQAASDARATADHATLVALHELSKKQVGILDGQNAVLDILQRAIASGQPGDPGDRRSVVPHRRQAIGGGVRHEDRPRKRRG